MITDETNPGIVTDPEPAPDAAHAAPLLDVEDFLLYRLAMLSRRLSDALEAHYGPRHGLQRAQWRMLALIGTASDCTASELVRRASLDAVAVHRAVGQLIERGLVLRRPSPQDGRVKLLRLSARGRRMLAEIAPVARALEQRALAALPEAEARVFVRALARLQGIDWAPAP
jgi:DNA-binding MarR family transcriptional regulator